MVKTDTSFAHRHAGKPEQPTDAMLRRDIRMLGFELGKVLREHGSPELYNLVERVRQLAKARRAGSDEADDTLRNVLSECSLDDLTELARALTCFFDLANLAEDRHRIRVLRYRSHTQHPNPRRESPGAALVSLSERGLSAEQAQALLDRLNIELVFTAHPTEAKRRTVRNTLKRLRDDIITLDRQDLLPSERETLLATIRSDLDCLWETDTLRPNPPSVMEEVRRSLFVFEPLWDAVPWLYGGLRSALSKVWPDHAFDLGPVLRFGTWIGGDRDGNPFVTPIVTAQTLNTLRQAAIRRHIDEGRNLFRVLSISDERHPVSAELNAALETAGERYPELDKLLARLHPREKYRRWLNVIEYRLLETAGADAMNQAPEAAYQRSDELVHDLKLIAESLRANDHAELANGPVQKWIDRAMVFGFHFACLDIREDAQRLGDAVDELARHMGLCTDYASLDEAGKQAFLTAPLPDHPPRPNPAGVSETASQTLALFELLHKATQAYAPEALGCQIASMTKKPSDVLTFGWLSSLASRLANDGHAGSQLPIVPLFETIDDLANAGRTLDGLLSQPTYRAHVAATGDKQICMVGYSDSTKDGGVLAANWRLHTAEREMAQVAQKHGVKLMCFHGRGGALGRGGGPAARGILSLPAESVDGRIRITEQGEVLAERYDDPEIAYRHLEQVAWATINITGGVIVGEDDTTPVEWREAMETAAGAAKDRYRTLRNDEAFIQYFREATPISVIETMAIGSRPSRRRTMKSLDDLRAIPYTFAWNQSRHGITAFFGIGAGLEAANQQLGGDWQVLRDMYARWPFFRAVIDNTELALAKVDMPIAHAYADLCEDAAAGHRLWAMVRAEFDASRAAVLAVTQQDELMSESQWLQRSIKVRNPYVDALSFVQVELLKQLRAAGESPEPALVNALKLTVQGVAAGLRTTG